MLDFDRTRLTELIKEAKGGQTLDELAAKTGISKFQLSRIMNGNYKRAPHMSTLRKIAGVSGIPGLFDQMVDLINATAPEPEYEIEVLDDGSDGFELLAEGPYNYVMMEEDDVEEEILEDGSGCLGTSTGPDTDAETHARPDSLTPTRNMCKACITMSMASLGMNLQWSKMPEEDNDKFIQYPFRLAIKEHPIQKWSFVFLFEYGGEDLEHVMQVLGRLAVSHPLYNEKISLVFTDRDSYIKYTSREMTFSSYPLWNMNLSAMLVNFSEMCVTEECYLFLSDDMTEESIASLHFPDSLMDDFILENVLDYRKKRK